MSNYSFTLSEEHKLWMFKNRMLKKLFGSREEKARGELKKLHNKKTFGSYCSRNIIQAIKWTKHGARLGGEGTFTQDFDRKT